MMLQTGRCMPRVLGLPHTWQSLSCPSLAVLEMFILISHFKGGYLGVPFTVCYTSCLKCFITKNLKI